jgi:hypothetical protein
MNRRLRFLAAIATLFAFSAYFAESVWAATCPPELQDATRESAAAAVHASDGRAVHQRTEHAQPGGGSHAGHAVEHGASGRHGEAGNDGHAECPFAALGMTGCVSVSLASPGTSFAAAAHEQPLSVAMSAQLHDVLLIATLFHPPRA